MYQCPLGDAVCLIMQQSLTWEFSRCCLLLVIDFTALFWMAVYENACFSYWCGNYFQMWWGCRFASVSPPHTHTFLWLAVLGIHFPFHGKGTKIDRKSREIMLEFLSVSANACMLSSWGVAEVHHKPHDDVYPMWICSSEDETSWVNLHRLSTFVIWALLKCWILLGFFFFDYFTCIFYHGLP